MHQSLMENQNEVHKEGTTMEQVKDRLDKIDKFSAESMSKLQWHCRKLMAGNIPFSLEASTWIKWTLVYFNTGEGK